MKYLLITTLFLAACGSAPQEKLAMAAPGAVTSGMDSNTNAHDPNTTIPGPSGEPIYPYAWTLAYNGLVNSNQNLLCPVSPNCPDGYVNNGNPNVALLYVNVTLTNNMSQALAFPSMMLNNSVLNTNWQYNDSWNFNSDPDGNKRLNFEHSTVQPGETVTGYLLFGCLRPNTVNAVEIMAQTDMNTGIGWPSITAEVGYDVP